MLYLISDKFFGSRVKPGMTMSRGMAYRVLSGLVMFVILQILSIHQSHANSQPLKIAVVDVQYVIENSVAVADLRKSIDKISEKLHNEMSDKETRLKNQEKEILQKKASLKQDEFDKLVNAFYKEVSNVQQNTQKKKAKLEQAHSDAVAMIHKNVLKIIAELSREKKYNIALPISQILYTDDTLSITNDVINILNNNLKSISLDYK